MKEKIKKMVENSDFLKLDFVLAHTSLKMQYFPFNFREGKRV